MEIHHSPPPHKKKKFREYLLEVLMIFIAIMLSFFAENIRDYFSDKHKEKEYAKLLLQDLKTDTSEMRGDIWFSHDIIKGLDSLAASLYAEPGKMNTRNIYRMNLMYARRAIASFSDRASSQLKAGGLSYIKNMEIASEIADYWQHEKLVEEIAASYNAKITSASELGCGIFNRKYYLTPRIDTTTGEVFRHVDSDARLMTQDSNILVNFANRITSASVVLNPFYLKAMNEELNRANKLIALIKKEYNIE